ncbi:MAG: hypothetical protein ABI539_09240 [Acidobacteriota bacterium]
MNNIEQIELNIVESKPDELDAAPLASETANLTVENPARSLNAAGSDRRLTTFYLRYLLLPFILLSVTLFGGMRLDGIESSFLFLKPPLFCLVFAAISILMFFRAGVMKLDGWLSERFSMRENAANAVVLIALFAATVQVYNSLLPEVGVPFWVVAFCFSWSLLNYLLNELDPARLIRSMAGLFAFAFVAKYLILANLTAPAGGGWLRSVLENPAQEAFTWLLSLPRFAPGTGYIQFFALILYLAGLYLIPQKMQAG